MTAPTEYQIRAALLARLNHPTDSYGRNVDWIDYLSDGLLTIWDRRNDAGDLDPDPDLERLCNEAAEHIARAAHAIAIEEFVAVGQRYAARTVAA